MVKDNVLCADIMLMNVAEAKMLIVLIQILQKKRKKLRQMAIKHVCFDLDGTLVRSAKTIYKTTTETLNQLGINYTLPEDKFNQMIGQHFKDIFEYFSINVPDFEYYIKTYKKNYFLFVDYSDLYEGIRETLEILKSNSIKISLLTTKAQDQAEKILTHFNLDDFFDVTMGRRDGIPHKPAPEPLILICDDLKIPVSETLMVGDTELDILCGKNAGSKTCVVTYGYRDIDILKSYNPDYLINSIDELVSIINDSSE